MVERGTRGRLRLALVATALALLLIASAGRGGSVATAGGPPAQALAGTASAPARSAAVDPRTLATTATSGPLAVQPPVANPSVVDSGDFLRLNVTITGGTKPYQITWLGLPSGCLTVNATVLKCHPGAPTGAPTSSDVAVNVVDETGTNVTSAPTTVTVNPDPSVAISAAPTSAGYAPLSVNLTATTYFGTPPFSFFWSLGDGTNATGAVVPHTYTGVGSYAVEVWANDSAGTNATGHFTVHAIGTLSVALAVAPSAKVATGSSVTLAATVQGGLGPFSYAWTGLPSSCPALNTSTILCTSPSAGSYSVEVEVTDFLHHDVSANLSFTVSSKVDVWGWVAAVIVGAAVAIALAVILLRRRRRRVATPPSPAPSGPGPSA
jgi:large repetitive protein